MHGATLSLLNDVTARLSSKESLDARLTHVADATRYLLGADHASIRLRAPDGRLLPVARAGVGCAFEPVPFVTGRGLMGWVAASGETTCTGDAPNDPRFEDRPERGYPVRSLAAFPLCSGGRVLGVLTASAERPDAFHGLETDLGTLLANCASQSVRLAELTSRTTTDPLTGAFNSRYLMPRLDEEMERARRHDEPLSVLLLDLDHFKTVNDRLGHAAGDEVLRIFAAVVRHAVRSSDAVVRYGGEEFVVVMPRTSSEQARQVAARIRNQLAGRPLVVGGRPPLWQTVSVGVATWDEREVGSALLGRADRAMYEAKRTGRNRVTVAATAGADPRFRLRVAETLDEPELAGRLSSVPVDLPEARPSGRGAAQVGEPALVAVDAEACRPV